MPNQPENGRSSSRSEHEEGKRSSGRKKKEREVSRNIKRERDGGDVGGDARDDRGTARDDRGSARGGEGQEGYGKDGKSDGDTVCVVRGDHQGEKTIQSWMPGPMGSGMLQPTTTSPSARFTMMQ